MPAPTHQQTNSDAAASEISIVLNDGTNRTVPAGTTPAELAATIGPRLAANAIHAIVNNTDTDLTCELHDGDRIEIVTPTTTEACTPSATPLPT